MATGTAQPGNACTGRSADDVRNVPVAIVALLRIIGGSVTIYATRMGQH
jgi:hypothetical protein